jgi:hypothetical protein
MYFSFYRIMPDPKNDEAIEHWPNYQTAPVYMPVSWEVRGRGKGKKETR